MAGNQIANERYTRLRLPVPCREGLVPAQTARSAAVPKLLTLVTTQPHLIMIQIVYNTMVSITFAIFDKYGKHFTQNVCGKRLIISRTM